MTSTMERSPSVRARVNALGWLADGPGHRRDRKRIAGGVAVLAICGWLFAALFLSAGSREDVLAVTRPVDRFAELSREDLRTVRVATDADGATVPASQLEEVLGRPAAVGLVPGALLSGDQVLDADDPLVQGDERVVGTVLSEQVAPSSLEAGDEVDAIILPPASGDEGPRSLAAWVLEVEESDRPGRDGVRVDLVVPASSGAEVATAAAEDRLSLTARGRP